MLFFISLIIFKIFNSILSENGSSSILSESVSWYKTDTLSRFPDENPLLRQKLHKAKPNSSIHLLISEWKLIMY